MRRYISFVGAIVVAAVLASCGSSDCPTCGQDILSPCQDKGPGADPALDPLADPGDVGESTLDDTGPTEVPDPGDVSKEIGEGEFGYPCLKNTDCDSGFCVEGIDGFFCTKACLEDCPDDWVCRGMMVGQDFVSLCVPVGANLCKPCKIDTQCGDGVCLTVGDGKFCGKGCEESPCPKGYNCEEVAVGELETRMQCIPKTGACDCNVTFHGAEKPCVRESEFGVCLGFTTCDSEFGWIDCTATKPGPEECDGIDNDCNGVADDGWLPPEEECENKIPGIGACPGQWVCKGSSGLDCVGNDPKKEVCNYIDDNCDGLTDEDFRNEDGKYTDMDHCGLCGNSCEGQIPFAKTTACDPSKDVPQCVVEECFTGYYKASDILCLAQISNLCMACVDNANCGPANDVCIEMEGGSFCGRDCSPESVFGESCPAGYVCKDIGPAKQCIPASGSCNCNVANAGIHRVCGNENEYGSCYGTETCVPALGWVNCTASVPYFEVCNGLDDNCNGFIDDNMDEPPELCQNSWTDPATNETYTCSAPWQCKEGGLGVEWVCEADTPQMELCNYQDDNCNGEIDEDYKVPGTNKYGAFDSCGACGVSCEDLVLDGTSKCDVLPLQPRCVVDECFEGYWKATDLSCMEFPDSQCQPCASDKACLVPGDACLPTGDPDKTWCLWDCSLDSLHEEVDPFQKTCPEGFYCKEQDDLGDPLFKCMPLSDTCDCLEANDSEIRICEMSNEFGTCLGQETCDPALGWLGCTAGTPAPEVCNGKDDDCNDVIDEPFPELNAPCFLGVGECRAVGVMVCNPSQDGVECDAVTGLPVDETCDGLDNDCDEEVDEEWPGKGSVCALGEGECYANGIWVCRADGSDVECNAVEGVPLAETCDGLDNDCDGEVDEEWADKGKPCSDGQGECLMNGVLVCSADGSGIECSAQAGPPGVEVCDDLDNDCDGDVDEDWQDLGKACTKGIGECNSTGIHVCTADGSGIECNAVEGVPVAELCDGKDNNCEGNIDEAWLDLGKVCTVGQGECYQTGTNVCTADGSGVECTAVAGVPSLEECDGLDNDCDGAADEDWVDLGKACTMGQGECYATGIWVCLQAGSGVECNALEGLPEGELCDGRDNDCDGEVDEDWDDLGKVCTDGLGECYATGIHVCLEDESGVECNAEAGTPSVEVCDGKDNDCDGGADEDWIDLGKACTAGQGECYATGTQVCLGDGSGIECNAVEGTPQGEACDGKDNDCDGEVDENWADKGKPCSAGQGECLVNGVQVCSLDGSGIECDAVAGNQQPETCDGLDNDCDGDVDETWPDKGKACTTGQGECLANGVNVCSPDGSGIECDAVAGNQQPETCDGLDNDCDGDVDEDWADKGKPCSTGQGECLVNGVHVCRLDGSDIECNAVEGTPQAELCDGLDNDCDGDVDEDWADKGKPCSAGQGECLVNGVQVCSAGGTDIECNAVEGTPQAELCDGLDNDCDGDVDEDWADKGKACSAGLGECLANGVNVCLPDGSDIECDAVPNNQLPETCDGLDNDCDGDVDENWPDKGKVCATGQGECLANGVQVCLPDGSDLTCDAVAGNQQPETCDGLDNDCDGDVDEDWADKGKPCSSGQGECLANGVQVCLPDGSGIQCDAVEGVPSPELCDDLDNNCDGAIDELWPDKNKACTAGQGECLANGVNVCRTDGLDIECDAVAGTPTAEVCDDLDNDCDGAVDQLWPDKGSVCLAGIGECQRAGTQVCRADEGGLECDATPGDPDPEVCDYLDNNCNGAADETFLQDGKYYRDEACANCFTDCTQIWTSAVHHAQGKCDSTPATPFCYYVCDPGYEDADGNPDNGCELFLSPLALYVSTPSNGGADVSTCGAWDSPCASIGYGLGRAQATGKTQVLVSEGIYPENVTIISGISILGGYNAATWQRDPDTNVAVISGNTANPGAVKHKKAVVANGITGATELSGFTIYGENNFYYQAGDSGGNSYAIWIRNCSSSLTIQDNVIYAGRGSTGAPGTSGLPGEDGDEGDDGWDAFETYPNCSGEYAYGGAGGENTCGGTDVHGGDGGTSGCPQYLVQEDSGDNGLPVGQGGDGGEGGYGRITYNCGLVYTGGYVAQGDFGSVGSPGSNGNAGGGCSASSGTVSGSEWVGVSGAVGSIGSAGTGGGGGGAGGGVDVDYGGSCSAPNDTPGSGGGGGGAGGCSGAGGTGGFPGGASFAVFVVRTGGAPGSVPVIHDNVIIRNHGGNGGQGGSGGNGGIGGQPGHPGSILGLDYSYALGSGGFGAAGGNGGHGGGAGGGCGGLSVGIMTWNATGQSPDYCQPGAGNAFSAVGTAGAGGPGGPSAGNPGGTGSSGVSDDCDVQ